MIVKFISAFILCAVALICSSYAQVKSCDLQLKVFEQPASGSGEKIPVDKVQATLAKLNNERANATTLGGAPYFSALTEGYSFDSNQINYRIIVKKDGYKTTVKSFRLDCSKANEKNVVLEAVSLWKGNKKEKIHSIDDETLKFSKIGVVDADLVLKMPKPDYPVAARLERVSGAVLVEIIVNEQGDVISAQAVKGHPLLRSASVEAAKKAKVAPTFVKGNPTKVKAYIVYNFNS